jgi:hypothetical protein
MKKDAIAFGVKTERTSMTRYSTFIGIDYSGAQHSTKPLTGIQVYRSQDGQKITKIIPENQTSDKWCRSELALWLIQIISQQTHPMIVGIDHAMSFPLEYFEKYNLPHDWSSFLDDFELKWPTHFNNNTVSALLKQNLGDPEGRSGDSKWRRLTDRKTKGAKSVFHFGVPGAVASSTHAGLTWINYIRKNDLCREKIHFWPFDGWRPAEGKTVIAEVYPALWNKLHTSGSRTQDEHDAWCIAKTLRTSFSSQTGYDWFDPDEWKNIRLTEEEKNRARIEGWILGLN